MEQSITITFTISKQEENTYLLSTDSSEIVEESHIGLEIETEDRKQIEKALLITGKKSLERIFKQTSHILIPHETFRTENNK